MKTIGILTMAALSTLALAARTSEEPKREEKKEAKAELGKPAPDFELKDVDGKAVKLSDYKGKTVVLEWFNPECPYVVYAHTKGPLKGLDAKTATDGVVWLAINSSAAGKEGSGAEKNKKMRKEWNMAATLLIDEEGVVGRMYGAKNTPHMYIVDSKGNLAYRGGLDNAPLGEVQGKERIDYVSAALTDLAQGHAVGTSESPSYGCSVKY